jgi:hypothetical protein
MHPSPLTGGFFTCVIYHIHMNTPLCCRPVKLRLKIAYIIDTILDTPECEPGNTVARMFDDSTMHPYSKMWGRIQTIYGQLNWGEMSDDEINNIYTSMLSVTTKFRGFMVEPMSIMRTKQRWDARGWARYECKRNGRRQIARVAAVPVLACFGIVLPQ